MTSFMSVTNALKQLFISLGAQVMKEAVAITDGLLSGIVGAIIGGCLALTAKPEGIVINVNIEFLVILLTILALCYLLLRLKLKIMQLEDEATQQPDREVGAEKKERLWDTPSRPITPTPADTVPSNTPVQPTQLAKPEQQPSTGEK